MAGILSKLAKPFRSTLADFAKKHKMEAMPGKQWEAYIKANAPKDAKKEAEASGLYKMLDKYEGKVSKDQIAEHLKKKLPKVKTKDRQTGPKFSQKDIQDAASYEEPITLDGDRYVVESTDNGYSLMDMYGNPVRNERSSGDLADYINQKYSQPSPYESYTLPGGEDYKETLIQLERQAPDELPEGYGIRELEKNGQKFYQASTPSTLGREWNAPEMAQAELKRYADNIFKSRDYQSSHFKDEPNILAHIRTKQRELPTGERVHFLEELQSDWGQAAREGSRVPEAPYIGQTEDWTKLALKKAIEQAAEGGQDYLAWTTGPQQSSRYNLSQAIKSLNYDPKQQLLRGYDPEGEISIYEKVAPEEIPRWIGKEPAQALLQTTPDELGLHRLRGIELDVGGKGMHTYYDQIVPNVANDLMKQLGVPERVQMLGMETGQQPGLRISPELRRKVMEEGMPYFSLGAAPLALEQKEPQAFGKGGVVRSSIEELRKMIENLKGIESGKRVQEAADLVPNLENQYSQEALTKAFTGRGDNAAAGVMVIDPADFEKYAQPLPPGYPSNRSQTEYIDELAGIARKKGFDDVPYLILGRKGIPELPEELQLPREMRDLYIAGHEGRHRSRALSKLGDDKTLVRMLPAGSMREHLPRYTQQDYLEALRKELGTYPMVRPEKEFEGARQRDMVPMPRVFAKGGEVDVEYDEKYEFKDNRSPVTIEPRAGVSTNKMGSVSQKQYNLGADINLFDKYGIGADAYGYSVRTPEEKFKGKGLADLRAHYITDEGVVYSGGYTPHGRAFRLSRTSPEGATFSLERTPERQTVEDQGQIIPGEEETTWIKYSTPFAEGGEVDLDQQYEFIDNSKNFAPSTEVDYDAMYDFK